MVYRMYMHALFKRLWVAVMITMLAACSTTYTAMPISGRVVDAVTKEPVADANVLVTWSVYVGTHRHFEGYLEVKEAVTNENGEFHVEGWGPRKNPFSGSLTDDEPEVIIFKPWYHMRYLHNYDPKGIPSAYYKYAPERLEFFWNTKTIEIKPFDDRGKYVTTLDSFRARLLNIYLGKACDWAKAPKILLVLSQEYRNLLRDGYHIGTMDISYIHRNKGCPTLESVFGAEYQ